MLSKKGPVRSASCVILIILVLGLVFLVRESVVAQREGILQLDDLPADTIVLTDTFHAPNEISHPLTSNEISSFRSMSGDTQQLLFAYKAVHSFSALLPNGVVVANFLYEYTTESQAERVAELLQNDIAASKSVLPVSTLESKNGLQGQGFSLTGDEGDSVYWFVGTQGQTLVLLMVNGMEQPSVSLAFESTMQKLMNK